VFIYRLHDPRDHEVRYVGRCVNPKNRLAKHVRNDRGNCHRVRWINSLREQGLKPVMEIIEECDDAVWRERERHWIAHHLEQGDRLTNATVGGDGIDGYVFTEEQRARLSESHKGLPSPRRGIPVPVEVRQKVSDSMKGKPSNFKGKQHTEEAKQKVAAAKRGKPMSPEARAKMSESARLAWEKRRDNNRS
jgi:hypothetical protein